MKVFSKFLSLLMSVLMTILNANLITNVEPRLTNTAIDKVEPVITTKAEPVVYHMSDGLKKKLKKIYSNYNFQIGWGLYDISQGILDEVESYNVDKSFQSNCTIKAAMLLYICKQMDAGKIKISDKLYVNKGNLHYDDFPGKSGNYSYEYLLKQMIHVSNNACYEVILRKVTKETFNTFLESLGSETRINSYNFMGYCTPKNRAIEWLKLYQYCHSNSTNSQYTWDLLKNAKYSPIRDGLNRTVAHKSGWHYKKGAYGTAGDCAVVQTDNGGCYLVVIFTKNNVKGKYSKQLIRDLAVAIDNVWNEYYGQLKYPKVAIF